MGKQLKEKSDILLKDINTLIGEVIVEKQTNEPWFLDFLKNLSNVNKGDLSNFRKWNIKKLPKKPGIYCFENKINGKLYIGQSQNIKERIRHHIKSKDQLYIHKALRKYGIENFNFYILEFCDIDKLSELEMYYIQKYNAFENGYNLTKGGEGSRGVKLSDKHKNVISEKLSKETWAYNFRKDYFLVGSSCKDISDKLLKNGYNIKPRNIYDAISRKSYSEDFTFGHTLQEAKKTSRTIKAPKNIEYYLYNYKTKKYSNKFTSILDGEQYIRQCGYKLKSGHLHTAMKKQNKYIKDFIFGYSMEELNQKIKDFVPELYLYNVIENKLFKFPNNISLICQELTSMGYVVNESSFRKLRSDNQSKYNGFIMGKSIQDLLNKIMSFNIEMSETIYNLSKENNYLNSQELIDWQDKINEISVK